MNDIFDGLKKIAAGDGRGAMAEIVSTRGSAPRKAGTRMLLSPDGTFSGTVGGGSLEYRAELECRSVLETGLPSRKAYSLSGSDGEGEDIGAICGGSAVIDFRTIDAAEAQALLESSPRPPRVLLYGAGHVGKALADALHLMDVPVIVADERENMLTEARFPHAERRVCPAADAPMDPEPQDMVAIMTHGHALDYALLRRAMDTPAEYIGLVASRRKNAMFRTRLMDDGVSAADVERRLHCPIGLAIGAETPEEIAVSIAAELIAHMHRTR